MGDELGRFDYRRLLHRSSRVAPITDMIEVLAQIRAGHFTAGVVLWDDKVVEAAPIIGYMKKQKWTRDRVRNYCNEKGWEIGVIWQMNRSQTG